MNTIKQTNGAQKYLDNARELLKKAGKEDGYYENSKYVRMACGTAYIGVELAVKEYLIKKGKPIIKKKHQRVSVDDYRSRLTTLNKKLLNYFNGVYGTLHLNGYYEGVCTKKVIDAGMEVADEIITGIQKNIF